MKALRFLLFPFAILYGGVILLRNFLYASKFYRSSSFNLPIINIGNLSMGGTGKTPHTEYLIKLLKGKNNVVTLSRGFGRKVQGFQIANEESTANSIGDEPLQYFKKFGKNIHVAVEANRVHGVLDICRELPATNLILLDDAFQHRGIKAGLNILLTTAQEPFNQDFILPVGNLREFRKGANRADIIIITKCSDFENDEVKELANTFSQKYHKPIFKSRIAYGDWVPFNPDSTFHFQNQQPVILVTGIANADSLKSELARKNQILHHFNYGDHHRFSDSNISEIHNLFDKFVHLKPIIVTTEKDAMRLMNKEFLQTIQSYPWFYQSISIEIDDANEFNKLVLGYVEKNS